MSQMKLLKEIEVSFGVGTAALRSRKKCLMPRQRRTTKKRVLPRKQQKATSKGTKGGAIPGASKFG